MQPALSGRVLACDLDGTLVRLNTFPVFVRRALLGLVAQGDVRGASRLVAALIRRKVLRGSHLRFKAAVHDAGDRLENERVERWVSELLRSQVNHRVLDLVRSWHGTTVLATAAPAVYATALGAAAGFDLVQGSDYHDGRYVENVHERKAAALRAVAPQGIACGITDDVLLDGPLLALSSQRLVVSATGDVDEIDVSSG